MIAYHWTTIPKAGVERQPPFWPEQFSSFIDGSTISVNIKGRSFVAQIHDVQIFASPHSTTLVLAAGYTATLPFGKPQSGELSYIWRHGEKAWRVFEPKCWQRRHALSASSPKLDGRAFSVSPDGSKVFGQFTRGSSNELWEYNFNTHKTFSRYKGRWSSKRAVPKHGFLWTESGLFWTPYEDGPLLKVGQKQIFTVASRAPFSIDVEGKIAFEFTDRKKILPDYKGAQVAHLIARQVNLNDRGNLSFGKLLWQSDFKVFPQMPEFDISKATPGYLIVGNLEQNYFLNSRSLKSFQDKTLRRSIVATPRHLLGGQNDGEDYSLWGSAVSIKNSKVLIQAPKFITNLTERDKSHQEVITMIDGQPVSFFFGEVGPEDNFFRHDTYLRPYLCGTNQVSKYPLNDAATRLVQEAGPTPN